MKNFTIKLAAFLTAMTILSCGAGYTFAKMTLEYNTGRAHISVSP